jgi:hypothetical protein
MSILLSQIQGHLVDHYPRGEEMRILPELQSLLSLDQIKGAKKNLAMLSPTYRVEITAAFPQDFTVHMSRHRYMYGHTL